MEERVMSIRAESTNNLLTKAAVLTWHLVQALAATVDSPGAAAEFRNVPVGAGHGVVRKVITERAERVDLVEVVHGSMCILSHLMTLSVLSKGLVRFVLDAMKEVMVMANAVVETAESLDGAVLSGVSGSKTSRAASQLLNILLSSKDVVGLEDKAVRKIIMAWFAAE
jgi:hypothetical protein